jgi:hypothetical protein
MYESTALKNYDGMSFVQYISSDNGDYRYKAQLQKSPKYSDNKMLQNNACDGTKNSFISFELPDSDVGEFNSSVGTFEANIDFAGDIQGPGDTATGYSLNHIKDTFNSNEFKIAKDILLSARPTKQ